MGGREKTKMSINAMGALDAARGAPSASRLGKTRGERARGVLRIVVVAAIIGISYWKHRQALAEEERLRVENEQRIQEEQRAQEEKRIQEEKRVQEEKAKADERRRKEEERKRASKQQPAPVAAPPVIAKKAKAGDLPDPDGIRRDELLADWLAQDSGVKVNEDFFAGDVAGRYRMALAKHSLAKEDGESWDAALSRYRAACMKRRAKRLAKVLAMAPRWVYARHAVMGDNIFAYTEALTDPAGMRYWKHRGSGLYYAEPDGDGLWRETPIAETGAGCYRDADVSPDGKRLLYSYKASLDGDDFHLYEMEIATGKVRQLTTGKGSADFDCCYLPDGRILFNSTRCGQIVDCWYNDVSTLFRIDADGRNMFRMTFDQVHDIMPTLNADGTVFYTRWEYNDRNELYSQSLFRMMPDGTNQRAYYGANGWFPTALFHARMVGSGPLVFAVRSGHHIHQAGELVRIDPREGRDGGAGLYQLEPLRKATPEIEDDKSGQRGRLALYPYPVDEQSVVLSFCPEGLGRRWRNPRESFGLYWTDVDGARELLVGRAGRKAPCGRPVPVCARKVFQHGSAVKDESLNTGTVYIYDVYEGWPMKGVKRGTVKSIRVVALEYRPLAIGHVEHLGPNLKRGNLLGMCSTPPALGNGAWDVKKVLGEVPVGDDGSAAFEAPARTPFYFQLLDEKGHAVQTMRSWTMLQPGEAASCVGCHENANAAAPTSADGKDKGRFTVKRGLLRRPERGFSFAKDVQPILDRRCVKCHSPEKDRTMMDLTGRAVHDSTAKRNWSAAYLSLTHATWRHIWGNGKTLWGWVGSPDHIDLNWTSSQSPPTMQRPYSRGSGTSRWFTERLDKGHCPELTDAERRVLACWVDLAVPFCGAYDEAATWTKDERARWDRFTEKARRLRDTYK